MCRKAPAPAGTKRRGLAQRTMEECQIEKVLFLMRDDLTMFYNVGLFRKGKWQQKFCIPNLGIIKSSIKCQWRDFSLKCC